jgi:hypothetical protein
MHIQADEERRPGRGRTGLRTTPGNARQGGGVLEVGKPRWAGGSEGRCRGPLAGVGTARYLAIAARTRRSLLWWRAGLDGARPTLAGTAIR